MSLRGYAKHRGVSLAAVQKAIAAGRITRRTDGKIDSTAADREWAANTAPSVSGRESARPGGAPSGSVFQRARTMLQVYKARLAALQFEIKSGQLVRLAEVQQAFGEQVVQAKTRLLGIGNKLAPLLATESSAAKCRKLVDDEIKRALKEVSEYEPGAPVKCSKCAAEVQAVTDGKQ